VPADIFRSRSRGRSTRPIDEAGRRRRARRRGLLAGKTRKKTGKNGDADRSSSNIQNIEFKNMNQLQLITNENFAAE